MQANLLGLLHHLMHVGSAHRAQSRAADLLELLELVGAAGAAAEKRQRDTRLAQQSERRDEQLCARQRAGPVERIVGEPRGRWRCNGHAAAHQDALKSAAATNLLDEE